MLKLNNRQLSYVVLGLIPAALALRFQDPTFYTIPAVCVPIMLWHDRRWNRRDRSK